MTYFKDYKFQTGTLLSVFSLLFFSLIISSCATMQGVYHAKIMKGSIIETYDSSIYLCVGEKDGATVGQEFNVYKTIVINPPPPPRIPRGLLVAPTFQRELTGRIKITKIIDEHFAEAAIISGKAEKNSIVELSAP